MGSVPTVRGEGARAWALTGRGAGEGLTPESLPPQIAWSLGVPPAQWGDRGIHGERAWLVQRRPE